MTADSSPLTPEAARRLAAQLAPHVRVMRALVAGTCYAAACGAEPAISPATTIFMAGMLDRISAGTCPGLAAPES